MTIPPPLLDKLGASQESVPKLLDSSLDAAACEDGNIEGGSMSEKTFRMMMNADVCATSKLAEGINAFVTETEKLVSVLSEQL